MSQKLKNQCPSLWIKDLLTMPKHPLVNKAFFFRGLRIKEVSVFGIITSVERTKTAITFNVDDGTGVVLCACDESSGEFIHKQETVKFLDSYRNPENTYLFSNMALIWMLERAIDVYDQNYMLQIGDSVHINGKISQCTDELRVITVSFICPLRDLKSEIIMIKLRMSFYEEILNNQKNVNKKKCVSGSFTKTDNDMENDSYNNLENDDSAMKLVGFQTSYPYVGEWHEEYFIQGAGNNTAEMDEIGDPIPDRIQI